MNVLCGAREDTGEMRAARFTIHNQIPANLLDRLDVHDHAVFEEHLVACAECQEELGGLDERPRRGALGRRPARRARSARRGAQARAEVTETGIGRVIEFRSDDLAILPKGEYYELWFVGPGDSRRKSNRISAGTFHPDPEGRSHVSFAAAVDPAKYPVLSVTAEPGDGDPRPSRREVLRSR